MVLPTGFEPALEGFEIHFLCLIGIQEQIMIKCAHDKRRTFIDPPHV